MVSDKTREVLEKYKKYIAYANFPVEQLSSFTNEELEELLSFEVEEYYLANIGDSREVATSQLVSQKHNLFLHILFNRQVLRTHNLDIVMGHLKAFFEVKKDSPNFYGEGVHFLKMLEQNLNLFEERMKPSEENRSKFR